MSADCQLLYIIGAPGAGKSTVLAAALEGAPEPELEHLPFDHLVYARRAAQLGKNRANFSGTDALAMNVQPYVVEWLKTRPYQFIVAEGDRLANDSFFQAVRDAGIHLTVVSLDTRNETAAQRRAARGSDQNPTWVKGRITKAAKLAQTWVQPRWRLNGDLPVDQLANALRQHPVIQGIVGDPIAPRAQRLSGISIPSNGIIS